MEAFCYYIIILQQSVAGEGESKVLGIQCVGFHGYSASH